MRAEFGGRLKDLGSKLDTVLQRTEVTDAVLFERAQDGSVVNRLEAFQGVVVALNAGATVLQNGLMQLHGTQQSMAAEQVRTGTALQGLVGNHEALHQVVSGVTAQLATGQTATQQLAEEVRRNNEMMAKFLASLGGSNEQSTPTG